MFNWFRPRRQTRTAPSDSWTQLGVDAGLEDRTVPCGADCMMMDAAALAPAAVAAANAAIPPSGIPAAPADTSAQAASAPAPLTTQDDTPVTPAIFAPATAAPSFENPTPNPTTPITAVALPPDTTPGRPTADAGPVGTTTTVAEEPPADDLFAQTP